MPSELVFQKLLMHLDFLKQPPVGLQRIMWKRKSSQCLAISWEKITKLEAMVKLERQKTCASLNTPPWHWKQVPHTVPLHPENCKIRLRLNTFPCLMSLNLCIGTEYGALTAWIHPAIYSPFVVLVTTWWLTDLTRSNVVTFFNHLSLTAYCLFFPP